MNRSEELTLKLLDNSISEEELSELEWLTATDDDAAAAHVSLLELEGLLRGRVKLPDQSRAIMQAVAARVQPKTANDSPAPTTASGITAQQRGVRAASTVHRSLADETPVDDRKTHRRARRKHKRAPVGMYIITLVVLIALGGGAVFLLTRSNDPKADLPLASGQLSGMQGTVQLKRGAKRFTTNETSTLEPGEGLFLADSSRAVVTYRDGTRIIAEANADIDDTGDPEADRPDLRRYQVHDGKLTVNKPDAKSISVALTTPHAVVVISDDAEATIEIEPTRRTRVDVTRGSVVVNSRFGAKPNVTVNAAEFTVIERGLPLVAKPRGAIERIKPGLIAIYRFQDEQGATVRDSARETEPLHLTINDPSKVAWDNRRLSLANPVVIASEGAAEKLYKEILNTTAMTIELWLKPAPQLNAEQAAVIFAFAEDAQYRNVQIDQLGGRYRALLRTLQNPEADRPLTTPPGLLTNELTHLVYVREGGGAAKFYVNGTVVAADSQPSGLDDWANNFQLSLGNVPTGDRPWLGDLRLVAVYDRELTTAEVKTNFQVGLTDSFVVPKPAAPDDGAADDAAAKQWVPIGGEQGAGDHDLNDFETTGGPVRFRARVTLDPDAADDNSKITVRLLSRTDRGFGKELFTADKSQLVNSDPMTLDAGTYYLRVVATDDFSYTFEIEEQRDTPADSPAE